MRSIRGHAHIACVFSVRYVSWAVWMIFLHFPAWTLLGFVGEADSALMAILICTPRLAFALLFLFLQGAHFNTLDICSLWIFIRVQSRHLEGRRASAHSLSWGSLLCSGVVSLKLSHFSDVFGGLREFHRHKNTVYSICSILVLKHKN